MASQPTYAQLVSLACHDLRTPLATATGFAHTLQRLDPLAPPADRYVEMIRAATEQMAQLLDLLAAATRIESGRFEPHVRRVDSLELAQGAVRLLHDGEADVSGNGAEIEVDPPLTEKSVAALAECVRRHGGHERVELTVRGDEISVEPLTGDVGGIAVGDDLRDFGAAVASRVIRALGGSVTAEDGALRISLPR